MNSEPDWLAGFLPVLRCPATKQPLRLATEAEKQKANLSADTQALSCEDGSHLYLIEDGIPILLPPSPAAQPAN